MRPGANEMKVQCQSSPWNPGLCFYKLILHTHLAKRPFRILQKSCFYHERIVISRDSYLPYTFSLRSQKTYSALEELRHFSTFCGLPFFNDVTLLIFWAMQEIIPSCRGGEHDLIEVKKRKNKHMIE